MGESKDVTASDSCLACHCVSLQGMARIESLDPHAFSAYLNETQNTICGRHPIAVLLNVSLVQFAKCM